MKRELGLEIPPERFRVVGSYSFVWNFRQQEPCSNGAGCSVSEVVSQVAGTADISTVHSVELHPDELERVVLENMDQQECDPDYCAGWILGG